MPTEPCFVCHARTFARAAYLRRCVFSGQWRLHANAAAVSDGNIHYSTRDNFRPPTADAVAALNRRLDNDNYRSVLLCDPNIAGGFCAGHIPEFWRLRVVDGYYGLGVPTRLANLPWKAGLSLRTISFTNPDQFDWPLLGLLNVKYAAKIPEAMYRNNSAKPGEGWRPADPNDVEIITNPLPVTPRYFFARHVSPVGTFAEAAAKLVKMNNSSMSPRRPSSKVRS